MGEEREIVDLERVASLEIDNEQIPLVEQLSPRGGDYAAFGLLWDVFVPFVEAGFWVVVAATRFVFR